jgi:hypothetical protein
MALVEGLFAQQKYHPKSDFVAQYMMISIAIQFEEELSEPQAPNKQN